MGEKMSLCSIQALVLIIRQRLSVLKRDRQKGQRVLFKAPRRPYFKDLANGQNIGFNLEALVR
jgi:hypothetical protein